MLVFLILDTNTKKVVESILVFVGLYSFVFARPETLQPRGPYFVSEKEDRRCWDRLAPDA